MQSDDLGLVERLTEEAERLSGHSIDRGSVDAGIASNLASEAAAAIERLVAAPEKLREVLRQILRCEYDGHGLNDCIDNDGVPYQSAFLANCIAEAENLVSESARQALGDA